MEHNFDKAIKVIIPIYKYICSSFLIKDQIKCSSANTILLQMDLSIHLFIITIASSLLIAILIILIIAIICKIRFIVVEVKLVHLWWFTVQVSVWSILPTGQYLLKELVLQLMLLCWLLLFLTIRHIVNIIIIDMLWVGGYYPGNSFISHEKKGAMWGLYIPTC